MEHQIMETAKSEYLSEPAQCLRKMMEIAPFFTLALLRMLTEEQWRELTSQAVFVAIHQDVKGIVKQSLGRLRLASPSNVEDGAGIVLLKLVEGKFLKGYMATKGFPRPYLFGSIRQLSRVVARSTLRRHLRDIGATPVPQIKVPKIASRHARHPRLSRRRGAD